MKLGQILTESLQDINARIDLANAMRQDIAAGELSLAQIARKYRVSKPWLSMVKGRMLNAGWMPGRPLPETALTRRRTPSTAPPPKHRGMSRSGVTGQSGGYRANQAQVASDFWSRQSPGVKMDGTAAARRARRRPDPG